MHTATEQDERWMRRALELARRGIGLVSPNPAVGCVIVDNAGQSIGEGWHEYDLKDHAEVAALRAAKTHAAERVKGATAYVTLEPCNHAGRTGPCSQALIEAGVARVVAATRDPNPLAAGGLAALHAAGVATEVGLCEEDARTLNEGFARWIRTRRPFVQLKVALSLDGRIAPRPGSLHQGEIFWITGEEARAAVQTMRWQADAVLTGIGTVLADDPLLTDRSGHARRRRLQRVVLDSHLRMPLDAKLVQTADGDVTVYTGSRDEKRADLLQQRGVRVEVVDADSEGHVSLEAVFATLGAESILNVLTETGTHLNTALLNGGFVDRLQLLIAPRVMGADAVPAFGATGAPLELNRTESTQMGADRALTSLLRDPWA